MTKLAVSTFEREMKNAKFKKTFENGLNENTNGLVRQYLKKGSSFTNITDDYLELIANQLNNRPRRSLEYATPNEVFLHHT